MAENAKTVAYSYIGPELTYPIYTHGTIGQAKNHLQKTAEKMNQELNGVTAVVSVNKALVTQASSAIPIVPLYLSILYKIMKEQGSHEDCIRQMDRLFRTKLLENPMPVDQEGRIRMDDWELDEKVQAEVMKVWAMMSTENLKEVSDIDGYWEDFYKMFGFRFEQVDYSQDVDVDVRIPSLEEN